MARVKQIYRFETVAEAGVALEGVMDEDAAFIADLVGVLVFCSTRRLRAGVSRMGLVNLRLEQKGRNILSKATWEQMHHHPQTGEPWMIWQQNASLFYTQTAIS